MEGHYNLAQNDDEIDVSMFAGGRNSAHYSQDGEIQYLDPTFLDSPSYIGDARLQTYRPRLSPRSPRNNYADLRQTFGHEADQERNPGSNDYSDLTTDNTTKPQMNKETLNGHSKKNPESDNVSKDPLVDSTNGHSMEEDEAPPDWLPPPPPTELNQFPVYAQVDSTRKNECAFSNKNPESDNVSRGIVVDSTNGHSMEEDEAPPDWLPPPPPTELNQFPVYAQVDSTRKNECAFSNKNPESDNVSRGIVLDSTNGHSMEEDEAPPDWLPPPPPTELNQFPVYAQVDPTRKKGFLEKDLFDNTNNRSAINGPAVNGDTSDEEDTSNWLSPPPPPPPLPLVPPGDSNWERPLPPEILALPGKRNRVASWAQDESDGTFSNGGVSNTTS